MHGDEGLPARREALAGMTSLPPGRRGLPILGETIPFLRDAFGFVSGRFRRHGPVFRSHVLFHPTAFIAGPEAAERWLDETLVAREGSMPASVQEIFGGRSLPLLDGDEHRRRKRLVMAAFSMDAVAAYLPDLERLVTRNVSAWVARGAVQLLPELKRLSIEGICANVLGLGPGPDLDALLADYGIITRGLTALPIPLPGTAYHAALRARDRRLAFLDAQIARHAPDPEGDGLSRMLAARADGVALSPAEARLECHHVVLAGLIVFAELAAIVSLLHAHPDVEARLRDEVARLPAGEPLSLRALAHLAYLQQVVMEVKRVCPNVPVSFGRTRAPFPVAGHTVPAGWQLWMSVGQGNQMPSVFREPERFDPDRFSPERAEHLSHPHAFVPQGVGSEASHRCAGLDYATYFMATFAVVLIRAGRFELPPQDLTLRGDVLPPEPADGLRVRFTKG